MGEEVIEVEIKGIIAISNEMDICLELEMEVPGNKNKGRSLNRDPWLMHL